MLRVIEAARRIAANERAFLETITKQALKPKRHTVGFPGGTLEAPVYYMPSLDLWLAPQRLRNRYWNSFGIGDPFSVPAPAPHIEINFPFEGIDRRIAGAFLEDEMGNVFVGHSGKVGGGTEGVSKSEFLKHYPATSWVTSGRKIIPMYVLGPLDGTDLAARVAEFARVSKVFRDAVRTGNRLPRRRPSLPEEHSFTDETDGRYVYTTGEQVTAERRHGMVVKGLRAELFQRGIGGWNDISRDLYTLGSKGTVDILFEVKTATDSTSIYCALGQLLFNGGRSVSRQLVVVLPAEVRKQTRSRLAELGIRIVTFRVGKSERVKFDGLDDVLTGKVRDRRSRHPRSVRRA